MSSSEISSKRKVWHQSNDGDTGILQEVEPISPHRVHRPPPGKDDPIYRPDILETMEAEIDNLNGKLRELSLDIHGNSSPSPARFVAFSNITIPRSPRDPVQGAVRLGTYFFFMQT